MFFPTFINLFTLVLSPSFFSVFFFFTDPSPTEIYTLSLHDALPICATIPLRSARTRHRLTGKYLTKCVLISPRPDRKSTRLNSSHTVISYAVFCLKKKKQTNWVGIQTVLVNQEHILTLGNSVVAESK